MIPTKDLHIYTDGGCLPNKTGSWTFVVLSSGQIIHESSGRASGTTCVRMELQAAIEALKILPEGSQGILWTDSRVLLEIVHTKMMALKNNGWLRSRGQPVIDLDLVQALDELMTTRKLEWRWVRAHSGNKYNDYCEQLCRTAYR